MAEKPKAVPGADVIVRFATASGSWSPTIWRDCIPPRVGDLVTIRHDGELWVAKCGPATIEWENGAQAFTVCYEPGIRSNGVGG